MALLCNNRLHQLVVFSGKRYIGGFDRIPELSVENWMAESEANSGVKGVILNLLPFICTYSYNEL